MANLRYAIVPRNNMMDQIRSALAGGSIRIYSGAQPLNSNVALSGQVLLVTLPLANPAGPAPVNGTFTFGIITDGIAVASGNPATFARMFQSDGVTVVGDCDVGLTGATLILDKVDIVLGGRVSAIGINTLSLPA